MPNNVEISPILNLKRYPNCIYCFIRLLNHSIELEREKAKLERSEALGEAQRVQRALAHKRIAKQFVPTRSSSVAQDRTGKVKEQIAEAEQTRKEEEAKRLVAQTERLKKKLRAEKEIR